MWELKFNSISQFQDKATLGTEHNGIIIIAFGLNSCLQDPYVLLIPEKLSCKTKVTV